MGGAELAGAGELLRAAGGDQDPARAEEACDLDAGRGHAGAGGVQQDVLVRRAGSARAVSMCQAVRKTSGSAAAST